MGSTNSTSSCIQSQTFNPSPCADVPHYEQQNQYYAVLNLVVTCVSSSRTALPARLQRTFYRWAESGLLRPSTMWRSRQEQQGRRRYLYDSMREQKKAQVSLGLELFLGHSER